MLRVLQKSAGVVAGRWLALAALCWTSFERTGNWSAARFLRPVLDDEQGSLIEPLIRPGRPSDGMPDGCRRGGFATRVHPAGALGGLRNWRACNIHV
jgi:hypothetical protein